jgi:hypothetical protein
MTRRTICSAFVVKQEARPASTFQGLKGSFRVLPDLKLQTPESPMRPQFVRARGKIGPPAHEDPAKTGQSASGSLRLSLARLAFHS